VSEPSVKRNIKKSGDIKTVINSFRSLVALGILALPYASGQSGLYLSSIFFFLIVVLCWYGIKLIVRVADDAEYYGENYHGIVEKIWGPHGGTLVSVLICSLQLSLAISCVLFTVGFVENELCHDFDFCDHKVMY